MPKLFGKDGKELVTEEEIYQYYAEQLPKQTRKNLSGDIINTDISLGGKIGQGEYTEEDIMAMSDLQKVLNDPLMVRKAAKYFDDLVDSIPELKNFPYKSNAAVAADIPGPIELFYIDGTTPRAIFTELGITKDAVGTHKNKIATDMNCKAAIVSFLTSAKGKVSLAYPVQDENGKIVTQQVDLKPDFQHLSSSEAQRRQNLPYQSSLDNAREARYNLYHMFQNSYREVVSNKFRSSSVYSKADEETKKSLNEENIEDDPRLAGFPEYEARWADIKKANPGIKYVDTGYSTEDLGTLPMGLTGTNDKPEEMSEEEYHDFRRDLYKLSGSAGQFGSGQPETEQLKNVAVSAFDKFFNPRLMENEDVKKPYMEMLNLGNPLDRIGIDGKPLLTYLREDLGYGDAAISEDQMKAETMAAITSGKHHIDIITCRVKKGDTGKLRLSTMSAEVRADLSGLDEFTAPGDLSRSQEQQDLEKKDLENRTNRLAKFSKSTPISKKASLSMADAPVNDFIKKNREQYKGRTGEPTPDDEEYKDNFMSGMVTELNELTQQFSYGKNILFNSKFHNNLKKAASTLSSTMGFIVFTTDPQKKQELSEKLEKQIDDLKKYAEDYYKHATKDGTKTSFSRDAGKLRADVSRDLIAFSDKLRLELLAPQKDIAVNEGGAPNEINHAGNPKPDKKPIEFEELLEEENLNPTHKAVHPTAPHETVRSKTNKTERTSTFG